MSLDPTTQQGYFDELVPSAISNMSTRNASGAITASATQTQAGGTALSSSINFIGTVTTASDAVTLPTAVTGREVIVINGGAEVLQIFPAEDDDLGAGVDTATTLAAGSANYFVAYDNTTWKALLDIDLTGISAAAATVLDDATVAAMVDTLGGAASVGTGSIARRNRSVTPTITAGTTQTQAGGTALTADINRVSVCANANDVVTLPTAVAGAVCVVINAGAQTLQIFPFLDDDLGAGVNSSTTLAAGAINVFHAYDATTWKPLVSAAAATVLDDATVAAMVDTLGGAASTGTGGLARATAPAFSAMTVSASAAVTAGTTQTQVGGTALTADINNVSVCANANDTVVLPLATAGRRVFVVNNGAQTLRVYPGVGDNLGAGVDAATTQAAGVKVIYHAYDATNWVPFISA